MRSVKMHAAWILVFTLGACDAGRAVDPIVPNDSTVTRRDLTAPIQTDSLAYSWTPSSVGWSTNALLTFRNISRDTMYLMNCQGNYLAVLEKRISGKWLFYLGRARFDCRSPEVVIAPDSGFTQRLGWWGALPGQNIAPDFQGSQIDGVYRVVIYRDLRFHLQPNGTELGDSVPTKYRYSNPFVVRR